MLSVFKQFQARAKRESGQKLTAVHTDNGGEYRGQLEEYCRCEVIKIEYAKPKTLELNGMAERMNRTIMEKVRCMQSHAKLGKTYWAEALMKAIYIINKSPSVPLDGDVPQRTWTGKDVSYRRCTYV